MRARNIKPGFFTNEQLVGLPFSTRILFVGLWCLADRRGLVEDRPTKIKLEVFPGDPVDVGAGLAELEAAGLIHRYMGDNSTPTIAVLNFAKHQRPHSRETENPQLVEWQQGRAGHEKGQARHDLGNVEPALNPDSGFLNAESGYRIPSSPEAGVATDDQGDPGNDTPEPMADPAAVMSLIAGVGKPMTADKAPGCPSAERKPEPEPTQPWDTDRATAAQPASDDGAQARAAAGRLAAHVATLDPACRPNDIALETWAAHILRLVVRDHRPWPEINQVMDSAFETGSWWAGRILNAADFARHYAKIRAQHMAKQAAESAPVPEPDTSPETMRSLYSTLESELADEGEPAARAWVARQKPNVRARLGKRLDKLLSASAAPT